MQPTVAGTGTPNDVGLAAPDEVKLLRAFMDHSQAGIVSVVGADGTLRYQFPPTLLGYAEGENLGRAVFDFLHPEDRDEAIERFTGALAASDPKDAFECRIRAADGTWHTLEIFADNRLADPTVEGLVVQGHDITERKAAEERLRRSEARFRSLVQHGNDIIVVIDADTQVSYVSPTVEPILGYNPEDLLGTGRPEGLAFVHPDDAQVVAEHFAAVVATPGVHTRVELRARHGNGSWRWLELAFTNQLSDPAVRGVVLNFRDVTERRRMQDELAHQALHDALTDLPNRALLVDRLEHALERAKRTASSVGVLFLDIDRFKVVNDTRGHAAGDALLAGVARRLRDATRASDTLARFGGDEFVVICEQVDHGELAALAKRLIGTLTEPIEIEGDDVPVAISVGAALGAHGVSADALLRDADAAMYDAKERGGGIAITYDESMGLRASTRYDCEGAPSGAAKIDDH